MKRLLSRLTAFAAAVIMAASCLNLNNDGPQTIYPIYFCFSVSDASGMNLMDTTRCDYVKTHDITATFRGKTYRLDEDPVESKASSVYPAVMYGLRIQEMVWYQQYYGYVLYFGQLAGDVDYLNEDLVIDWGDGTSDTITVYNKIGLDENGNTAVQEAYMLLNGERMTTFPTPLQKPFTYVSPAQPE